MRLPSLLRQRLFWKLLLSYLVIVLVAGVVLEGTAQFIIPLTLEAHTDLTKTETVSPNPISDLSQSFTTGVNEVLVLATLAATLAAIIVSVFTARRIVGPVLAMIRASQHIAAGDYHQRVEIPGQDEFTALAESFNRMATTLEQTERRRMELIGDVSHELRTPLASIRGSLEGVVDGVLPAEPETFLDMQRQVIRLQHLAWDLEDVPRAEAGQIPLDLQPVDLAELIRASVARMEPQFTDKGVELQVGLPDASPIVRADYGRITQVMTNLLGNALQYTPPGGRARVSAGRDAHEAQISIEDTGIGIAPEHIPHVFERFYPVWNRSRSRTGGGSGIGLTISRHLVEAHGGRIWAASPGAGQGSTFTFTLPLAD